ncbi:MAG: hypothetical protein LC749_10215 [Actinobacteria bacterium]|nr:hypothetical protein [Actinomycetota bacterium]
MQVSTGVRIDFHGTEDPSSHDDVTTTCPVCQRQFAPPGLLLRGVPGRRLPAPPGGGPAARRRPPGATSGAVHGLRVRRLRRPGRRQATLRRLLDVHAPHWPSGAHARTATDPSLSPNSSVRR